MEFFVCDYLSRSGYEVLRVDHTGLDIIAYNVTTKERLGISIKSRTHNEGKEREAVNVFFYRNGKDDGQKLMTSCDSFACKPWIAVYVENVSGADLYLVDLETFDKYCGGKAIEKWKMDEASKKRYAEDPKVKHLNIKP